MPPLSYKNDHDEDERLNPTSLLNVEHKTGQDAGINAGIDQAEAFANDPNNASKNSDELGRREESSTIPSRWKSNVSKKSNQPTNLSRKQKVARIFKKKGAGVGVGLGLTGIIVSMFLGLISNLLPVNLLENFSRTNDSSSTVLERRFFKVFGHATVPTNEVCKSSKVKCKMGRISNSALKKLEKKGIRADPAPTKRTGYPETNPKRYFIDVGNGKTQTVQAENLKEFLLKPDNRNFAAKVLGTGGAFNMRYRAWVGKHINNRFYEKFSLKRDGGIADGKNNNTDRESRYEKVLEKMRSRMRSSSDIGSVAGRINEKLGTRMEKAKKGGPTYMAAVAGCIAPKVPRFVAGGIASVQLAQLLVGVNDAVLSPGSKAKATGVENTFTPGDAEAVGTLLTEQTPRESDGKMTSALDSPYLLAAMGASTGKPAVSEDFAPGQSFLTNPKVQKAMAAEEKSAPACDKVLSSSTMYTAAAADSAVTVLASATVIGGIIKVAGSWAIGEILSRIVQKLGEKLITEVLTDIAKNDKIPNARGQELGDVIGIGAAGYFAAGGMARHLPTLKQSQVVAYDSIKQENEENNRAMAVASLSPFDTSSRYTFLGSILHNTQTAVIANGSYKGGVSSLARTAFSLPMTLAFPKTQAAIGFSEDYCGYAVDFGYDADGDAPAINMAGLPCTGITANQDRMETDTAIKLLANEGWFDETKDIELDDTIEELVNNGYIRKDTPLSDYIEACGDPSSGDYVFNAGSCTVESSGKVGTGGSDKNLPCLTEKDAEGNTIENCPNNSENSDFSGEREVEGVNNPDALEAIAVFLIDYQSFQSMNGEDEQPVASNTTGLSGGGDFTMMTFNIEKTTNKDTYKRAADVIKSSGASVIALQEMGDNSQNNLKEYLGSNYDGYPSRAQDEKLSYLTPVFWNKEVFEKVEGEDGQGVEKYPWSLCSGLSECAGAPWVKLRYKSTQQEIYVLSIHMTNKRRDKVDTDQGGAFQRERSAEILNEFAKKKNDAPVFIGGDFNSTWGIASTGDDAALKGDRERVPYCILTEDVFDNALDLTKKNGDKHCPTKVGDRKYEIDHLYSSRGYGITATNYKELSEARGISDHLPIVANYSIPGAEGSETGGPGWAWPVPGVKSLGILPYGKAGSKGIHKGIDIGISGGAALGKDVVAAHDGKVVRVWGESDSCGAYISIEASGTPYYAAYQHVDGSSITVKAGDTVSKGQKIAKIGRQGGSSCGSSGFYHLHFSIESKPGMVSAYADPFANGTKDPLKILPRP